MMKHWKDLPDWAVYQVDVRQGAMEPDTAVLRLNGRPEVIQLGADGINIFTSIEALDDGLEPVAYHNFLYEVISQ